MEIDSLPQIRLWDPKTGTCIGEPLRGHQKWITSLAWEPVHSSVVLLVYSVILAQLSSTQKYHASNRLVVKGCDCTGLEREAEEAGVYAR